jgi:hypothetical protein
VMGCICQCGKVWKFKYSIEGFMLISTSTFHIEYMQLQQDKMGVDDFELLSIIVSNY